MYLDIQSISNWIISGFIGLIFGIISAWLTHRYEKKRDEVAWEHEKEKLNQQFKQEKELVAIQFRQHIIELERQLSEQKSIAIRSSLTKGLENPEKEIQTIERSNVRISSGVIRLAHDPLINASRIISSRTDEMRVAIMTANKDFEYVRDYKSPKIARDIEQWDNIKSKLLSDLNSFYEAVKIFDKTASDIHEETNKGVNF